MSWTTPAADCRLAAIVALAVASVSARQQPAVAERPPRSPSISSPSRPTAHPSRSSSRRSRNPDRRPRPRRALPAPRHDRSPAAAPMQARCHLLMARMPASTPAGASSSWSIRNRSTRGATRCQERRRRAARRAHARGQDRWSRRCRSAACRCRSRPTRRACASPSSASPARGRAAETGSDLACRTRRFLESLEGFLRVGARPAPVTLVLFTAGLAAPRRDAPMGLSPGMCELPVEHFRRVATAAGAARANFYVLQPADVGFGSSPAQTFGGTTRVRQSARRDRASRGSHRRHPVPARCRRYGFPAPRGRGRARPTSSPSSNRSRGGARPKPAPGRARRPRRHRAGTPRDHAGRIAPRTSRLSQKSCSPRPTRSPISGCAPVPSRCGMRTASCASGSWSSRPIRRRRSPRWRHLLCDDGRGVALVCEGRLRAPTPRRDGRCPGLLPAACRGDRSRRPSRRGRRIDPGLA